MSSTHKRKSIKSNQTSSSKTRKESHTANTGNVATLSKMHQEFESDDEDHAKELPVIRKVSTKKQLRSKACIKEGYLMKQTSSSFQRWHSRYFKLRPRRLYFAKNEHSEIFEEIDLTDSSVAEKSTKKVNCSFTIIGPSFHLILCANSRKEMDAWISAVKAVQSREFYSPHQVYMDNFTDGHNWYACTHNRPTYCNVCREVLSGVMNHGLSCDVCKFKSHKRCAVKAAASCKWTTLATVGKNIIESEDGLWIPHQWLEGNLPVSAKCVVCDRTCGSVLRLQDWRCLWCRTVVHAGCRNQLPNRCPLGSCKMSILPPTSIHSQDSDDFWHAVPSSQCTSPLLLFVNSKSGDNQGVKFLRRFRQFLNPAQVFDLMCSGPQVGLQMFRKFDMFRILICGGDGSVGWVLTEMDKLNLSSKAQVGVLPLGTGNDLAQVMGWGNMCDDDAQVPAIIEKYERASAKLLDRWSILAYEGKLPLTVPQPNAIPSLTMNNEESNDCPITDYEDTVADHLGAILNSDKTSKVVNSAAVLCETVKDFVAKVGRTYSNDDSSDIPVKCKVLEEKLASLLDTLTLESKMAEIEQANNDKDCIGDEDDDSITFHPCSVPSPADESSNLPEVEESNKHKADFKDKANINRRRSEDSPARFNCATPTLETVPEVQVTSLDGSDDVITTSNTSLANSDVPSTSKAFQKKIPKKRVFEQRTQLMLRANSLKKAVRQIIEHTENAVDAQNEQTRQQLGLSQGGMLSTIDDHVTAELTSKSEVAMQSNPISIQSNSDLNKDKASPGLVSPSAALKSKSAPTTPTSTLDVPPFEKYSRQTSVACSSLIPPQNASNLGLAPLLRKSSTAINPLYNSRKRGSFLRRVLLANADTLCAPAAPLLQPDDSAFRSLFAEKCVLNNYFGIGLDAKITLDFHRKREDNPKKCSRAKNRVWFGMLATKEFAMKTYKNLEQRIRLECDGQVINLPALQGIVVLNIPSYAGGTNFWGGRSANEIFMAPSYNDKILEVVAVFSTVQLGMAIVVPDGVLQHHRIAQCRSVKITILGNEPVPLQADGEAWLQPPGVIKIEHKNRVQMLARDRRLEVALKSWEIKNRYGTGKQPISTEQLTDNEVFTIGQLAETATAITLCVSETEDNDLFKEELLPLASTVLRLNTKLRPLGRVANTTSRQLVAEFVVVIRDFVAQLESLVDRRANELGHELVEKSENWLDWLDHELKKIQRIKWVCQLEQGSTEASNDPTHSNKHSNRHSVRFKLFRKTGKREALRLSSTESDITNWSAEEVARWLEASHVHDETRQRLISSGICGKQLVSLESASLKDLGITKHEHVKRLLSAVKELQKR